MTINYIGLSCFLIENNAGYRILVDPFNDSPEWILGPNFPKEFKAQPLGANIVLMSEPDADHAYAPGDWLVHAPKTNPESNPFPNLQLRGTVVYEWNGDLNIAWTYTVDGIRLAHLADNAHILSEEQIKEIGVLDVLFISPSKPDLKGEEDETTIKNISLLKPKLIIWTHHIAPRNLPQNEESVVLREYFKKYFTANASTNAGYKGEESFMELCYVLENATRLNKRYEGIVLKNPVLEVTPDLLNEKTSKPTSILFTGMLAQSKVE